MKNSFGIVKEMAAAVFALLALALLFAADAMAERGARTASRGAPRPARRNLAPAVQKPEAGAEAEPAAAPEKREFDVASITKYNCGEFYGKCMGKTCYAKGTGRCQCGNPPAGKFDEANGKCAYIVEACPSQADDIVRSYVRNASQDCKSYAMDNSEGVRSAASILPELVSCMRPKCRADRTNDFVACFDEDNKNLMLQKCAGLYEGRKDAELLLDMFEKSMASYKKKYCDEMFGIIEDGQCILTIGIGVTAKAIKKSMNFRVGDVVRCSSSNFGVDLGDADALMKKRAVRNIALTGVRLLGAGLSAASTVYGAKRYDVEFKDKKEDMDPVVVERKSGNVGLLVTEQVMGDVLAEAVNSAGDIVVLAMESRKYEGKCYALKDGGKQAKELFPESDEVYYKLRWSDSWQDQTFEEGF
jgi:hypothetical protein